LQHAPSHLPTANTHDKSNLISIFFAFKAGKV